MGLVVRDRILEIIPENQGQPLEDRPGDPRLLFALVAFGAPRHGGIVPQTRLLSHASRQYDFREVRLTSSAQRGLASWGQSRPVLSAHNERGGQPWKSLAKPSMSVSMSTRTPSPSPTRRRTAAPRWCRWGRSARGSATSTS